MNFLQSRAASWFARVGLALLTLFFFFCLFKAFTQAGNDFNVFYHAWKLVLNGRGSRVYTDSPDRFLYGPGFAWLLAPFGFLSRDVAFAVWSGLKVLVIVFLLFLFIQIWADSLRDNSIALPMPSHRTLFGLSAWGVLLVGRPLLIDFEYGQVNVFILGAGTWALGRHFFGTPQRTKDILSWTGLAIASASKLLTLPLLLLPWLPGVGKVIAAEKIRSERIGILLGIGLCGLLPILSLGGEGIVGLLGGWKAALMSRGLPLESHNQSFIAFVFHYLTGVPTQVFSEGRVPFVFGAKWLEGPQVVWISLAWSSITFGMLLGWILCAHQHSRFQWIAIALAFLIVPSHLVWKPYLIMAMPLAVLLVQNGFTYPRIGNWIFLVCVLLGINFTGFDFVGHRLAPAFEAASIFLLMDLLMITRAASKNPWELGH